MLRFTIQDLTGGSPVDTVIDEPIGWDSISLHLKRDSNYHGFLDAVDDSLGTLRFHGAAFTILKNAYDQYGTDAAVRLRIDYACADTDVLQLLYQGDFSFDKYKEIRGSDGCYAECSVQRGRGYAEFKNRLDQKVSLDAHRCFDADPTDPLLPHYDALGVTVSLPSKTIQKIDHAQYLNPATGSNASNPEQNEFLLYSEANQSYVITPYATIQNEDLPDFSGGSGDIQPGMINDLDSADHILYYVPENIYLSNTVKVDIQINYSLTRVGESEIIDDHGRVTVKLYKGVDLPAARAAGPLHTDVVINRPFGGVMPYDYPAAGMGGLLDNQHATYSHSQNITFQRGEKLYLLFQLEMTYGYWHFCFYSTSYESALPYLVNSLLNLSSPYTMHEADDSNMELQNRDSNPTTVILDDASRTGSNRGYLYAANGPINVQPDSTGTVSIEAYDGTTMTLMPALGAYTIPLHGFCIVKRKDDSTYTLIIWSYRPFFATRRFSLYPAQPSFVRLTLNSKVAPTDAQLYLVNEALSRTAELITNDKLRVYSAYFGRTDSQPYTTVADGPAALEAVTNGLLIRQYSPATAQMRGFATAPYQSFGGSGYTPALADKGKILSSTSGSSCTVTIPPHSTVAFAIGDQLLIRQGGSGNVTLTAGSGVLLDSTNTDLSTNRNGNILLLTQVAIDEWLVSTHAPVFTSMKELLDGLHAIHAIGLGSEPDTERDPAQYDRLRIEPIRYFYDDTVTLTLHEVDQVERDSAQGSVATLHIGYQKWEAESTNGLDEFLTKRSYRTTLRQVRTALDKLSKFIASGYAIETTRRKINTNTTDWRYDNDTFILCLKRKTDGYQVEAGGIDGGTNMLDPATVYNWRISPVRNALRWLWYIFQSYTTGNDRRLIFTAGDGNYYAYGKEHTNPIETQALSENATLTLDDYATATPPLFKFETVKFKYPLSYEQWVNIYTHQYGLIGYTVNGGAVEYGWIQELKYNPYTGIAEFILKPKYDA
jgi:hypothetical protein